MDDPEKTLLELWRIGKPNAVIEIIVPYYNNKSAYSSMQHKYVFNDDCFKVFIEENKNELDALQVFYSSKKLKWNGIVDTANQVL